MVSLKSVQELEKDFVLRFLSLDYVRVLAGIVHSLNVTELDNTAAVLVQLVESPYGNVLSELIHGAADNAEELFIVNCAASISVEDSESLLN